MNYHVQILDLDGEGAEDYCSYFIMSFKQLSERQLLGYDLKR